MQYYEEIEWELLQQEKIFKDSEWTFKFPFKMINIKEIKINRDEFYNILLEIKCFANEKLPDEIKQFEVIDFIKIKSNFSSEEYLIKNLNITKYTSYHENSIAFLNIFLSPTHILFNLKHSEDVAWIKEWYLNGPNSKIIFPKSTTYSKKDIYEKILNHPVPDLKEGSTFKKEIKKQESISLNYIFCKLNNTENIIIGKVPDKMNPKWSTNISISYNSKKYINDKDLRDNIENIVSFVFGRKLIKIGESYYDSKGNKIKEKIYDPHINQKLNIKNICASPNKLPIAVHRYPPKDIELIMRNLINSFNEQEIDLSQMFTNYWNSTFLPIESRIILLAASLESLKNKWFDSKNSKSKGVIINKPLFRILIKDIKHSFNLIFNECDMIKDNFGGLNRLSINKGFEVFFEEIGMEIGDVELGAIKARNKPVHGNDLDAETYQDLIIYTEVYQILVNRAILTLLHFEGLYHINDFVEPVQLSDKIPYSLEELRDDIFIIETYDID